MGEASKKAIYTLNQLVIQEKLGRGLMQLTATSLHSAMSSGETAWVDCLLVK